MRSPTENQIRNSMGKFVKGHKTNLGKKRKKRPTPDTRLKWKIARTGLRPSTETRKKMSESRKGGKNSNWKGGVTEENVRVRHSLEYRLWREAVFSRDKYTCLWCGDNKGGNLNADHIKPFAYYPELRFAIDNGRTLCEKCHKTTDTYGNKFRDYKGGYLKK